MSVLLTLHIIGASLALGAGAVALSSAKGRALHRKSGLFFVAAMLAMCASAVTLALSKGQTVNVIAGVLTGYLVLTALATVRPLGATVRGLDVGLMLIALVLGITTMKFGFDALASDSGIAHGYPAFPFFMFAAIGLLGGAGDFRMLRSGGLRGARRLARHLWRMCWALWIATISFVSVRSRVALVLPEPFLTPVVRFLPVVLVVVVMAYWLWRIRIAHVYRTIVDGAALAHTADVVSE